MPSVVLPSGRDRALGHLRSLLTDPAVEGGFINEQDVADEVGVSRTPVREALLILASEGLVHLEPRRGARVAALTPRETAELMEMRGLIERFAVQRALFQRVSPHETLAEIMRRQEAVTDGLDRLTFEQARECIELDRRFHQALVDAAGNSLLSRSYAALRERQVRVGISALGIGPSRWNAVTHEHGAIVDALRAGDQAAAEKAIDDHLSITLRTILTGS
ncbi:DNA-binding GntR family transcriptional regulator [Microbacterium testaceum]|uniref:GntR family transcriptional regulator n=1 Tax=Microbacterium TaxID=33882 RepID=UPI002783C09C|nr:GntR family transcriptional regulator [Microbacterium testaceum]MDQ1175229.1 DNA-binding GntR family transcriptional regulator [Microbacterium testaceum]